jgi:hypothetical protein
MYAAGCYTACRRTCRSTVSGRIASYAAAQVVAKLGPRLESIDQTMIERLKAGGTF